MTNYPCGYKPENNPMQQDSWDERVAPSQEVFEEFIAWDLKFSDQTLQYYFDEMLGEDGISEECISWVRERWYEMRNELTDKAKREYDSFNKEYDIDLM